MASRPPFPGMNPYLENPSFWPEVHSWLIVGLARALNPQITPKYRAAIDTRVYNDSLLVGIPDVSVYQQSVVKQEPTAQATAVISKPESVTVPMTSEVTERFLEIREVGTGRVVTAVELLSPANKRKGEGRQQYLAKRQRILNSTVHLVEIDLLRAGDPMPSAGGREADYQILVSRVNARPTAERYPFDLQDAIPRFLLPLDEGEQEPVIDLGELLQQVCDETALDLAINYREQPAPSLSESDFTWLQSIVE